MSLPTASLRPDFDQELWIRLDRFPIDNPANPLSFTRRLARENDWSQAFASRVVNEYKRFVYLAMTAGHEVTPSDEVDQAWHLHLTYTRSYWDELCGEVLGRPLHHGPTKGGKREGQRFEHQYEQTLASYRTAFGAEPPSDIWPSAAIRFGEAASFVRINRTRSWVLPKPWRVDGGRPVAVAASLAVVIPPVAAGAAWNPLDFNGQQFLAFYAIVCALAITAATVLRHVMRSPDALSDHVDPPDDAESLAALRGGWPAVFQTAMAGLVAGNAIGVNKQGFLFGKYKATILREPNAGDTALQQSVLAQKAIGEKIELATLGRQSRAEAENKVEHLQQFGLLETAESWRAAKASILLLLGSAIALGLLKLGVGLWRDKPVGFLIAGLVVMVGVTVFMAAKPHRTRAGERYLTRRKIADQSLKQKARQKGNDLPAEQVALAVGLFGIASCRNAELTPLQHAIGATSASSGGSGGDGGGCGGGCGGCGGCG